MKFAISYNICSYFYYSRRGKSSITFLKLDISSVDEILLFLLALLPKQNFKNSVAYTWLR